jgi:predicted RNA binding protein with dsRBD fold (UPF0201 family)
VNAVTHNQIANQRHLIASARTILKHLEAEMDGMAIDFLQQGATVGTVSLHTGQSLGHIKTLRRQAFPPRRGASEDAAR